MKFGKPTHIHQRYFLTAYLVSRIMALVSHYSSYRGQWGTAVMRGKAFLCHSCQTKNGNKHLCEQQLQLTAKQIGTKNGQ